MPAISKLFFREGFTWRREPYFVERVVAQPEGQLICTSCVMGYWLEFANSKHKGAKIPMNIQWLVDLYGHFDKMQTMLKEFQDLRNLCLEEESYRREYTGIKTEPPAEVTKVESGYVESNPETISAENVVSLLKDGPIIAVIRPTTQFREYRQVQPLFSPIAAFDPIADHDKEDLDHAVLVVGYRKLRFGSKTQVLIKNPWGREWGKGAYAWVTLVNDPNAMHFGNAFKLVFHLQESPITVSNAE